MSFWRLFFAFALIVLYSFGARFEFLIGGVAILAAFFPQFWEALLFGLFFDILTNETAGMLTVILLLLVFFEEFLKKIIEPRSLFMRCALAFVGALFFNSLLFGWRFFMGAVFDINAFLIFVLIEALSISFFALIFFNVLSQEKN